MQILRVDLPRRSVGEGPVWDVTEQALYYIDILEQKVLRWHPASGATREWAVPEMIGSLALREQGGAIVALVDGIHALDLDSGEVTPLVLMQPANPAIQLADGKVDRAGRFVFGTSHRKAAEPVGGLFALDNGTIRQLDSGLTLGNGPCWSPDNATLYHADSMAHVIYAYDYDLATGAASNRREFFNTSAWGPIPDGATVDANGDLWVAVCEGGVVLCLSPQGPNGPGKVKREIAMPTRLPASCMFFGPDLDRLFVPSIDPSFLGREPADGDGWNYIIDGLGVQGLPEPRYHG